MHPSNKIGVYSLNNPFNRTEKLEQIHQESLKDRINHSLNNLLPRIKEVMTQTITEKVNGRLNNHYHKILELKNNTSNLKELLKESENGEESNLNDCLAYLKSNTLDLKETINDKFNFIENLEGENGSLKLKKEEIELIIEKIMNLLEKISTIRKNCLENKNYCEIQISIIDKLEFLRKSLINPLRDSSIEIEILKEITSKLEILQMNIPQNLKSDGNVIERSCDAEYESHNNNSIKPSELIGRKINLTKSNISNVNTFHSSFYTINNID